MLLEWSCTVFTLISQIYLVINNSLTGRILVCCLERSAKLDRQMNIDT